MNREKCIEILEKGVSNNLSFLEDNQYRYELQNQKTPREEYRDIIAEHQEKIDNIRGALTYLKENLK